MKIAIFTTTRAEFGIYSPLINEIERNSHIEYLLFVGGTHLLKKYGSTIDEIKNYKITDTFDFFNNEDTDYALAKSLGIETIKLAKIFKKYKFDFCCVLGDRFELLPIVTMAIIYNKPIIHLYGGEETQGAIDEQIRHMVTKAAHIHFVSCEKYAVNIRKMGEQKSRIFNVGSLGIDSIIKNKKIQKSDLFRQLLLDEKKQLVLLTYHPVTLEYGISPLEQIKNIFRALNKFDFQIIVTGPNIDFNRDLILSYINKQVRENINIHYYESLGINRYHSIIPYCKFIIGNSSSGFSEVPYFKKPTINIGDRQKGRFRHKSIIDTGYSENEIISGINKALSESFQESIENMEYKLGDGNTAEKIVKILQKIPINEKLMRKELEFTIYE